MAAKTNLAVLEPPNKDPHHRVAVENDTATGPATARD